MDEQHPACGEPNDEIREIARVGIERGERRNDWLWLALHANPNSDVIVFMRFPLCWDSGPSETDLKFHPFGDFAS